MSIPRATFLRLTALFSVAPAVLFRSGSRSAEANSSGTVTFYVMGWEEPNSAFDATAGERIGIRIDRAWRPR